MSKHTPGPWDYHIADGAEVPHVAVYVPDEYGQEERRIADVYGPNMGTDGALIAAAPALLEALRDVLKMHARQGDGHMIYADYTCAMDAARAALALVDGAQ